MKNKLVIAMVALIPLIAQIEKAQGPSASDENLEGKIAVVIKERVDRYGRRFGIVVGTFDAKGRRVTAYGKAKAGVEVDGDSIFNLGSVAKLFTATLLADMAERREVSLDDPIEKYLPPGAKVPARNGKKITLLDLATHTSGLPSTPGNASPRTDRQPGYVDYSERDLYEFLSGYVLTRDIGNEYEYSVSSPLIQAMQRSQQTFRQTGGSLGGEVGLGWGITRTADGSYLTHSGGVDGYNSFVGINSESGKAVVVLANSTVNVSDIGAAVLTGRLEMPVPGRRAAGPDLMGFMPDPSAFGAYAGVYEISPGYNALISSEKERLFLQLPKQPRYEMAAQYEDAFVIKEHLAEAWVQFLRDGHGRVMALSIRQDQMKATAKKIKAPETVSVSPEVYAALYEIGPDSKIVITRVGDRLTAQASGQPEVEIFPRSESDFFSKLDNSTISFLKDDEGRATGLLWRGRGEEKTAKRVSEPIAAASSRSSF